MSISHLINANIHRVKEGARVLEDIARFILKDEVLFNRIRKLRHSLQTTPPALKSDTDLGGVTLKEDNMRSHLIQHVQANAIRMQEALRVLEEFSEDPLSKQKMKSLRYDAYDLQQEIYKKTLRFVKQDKLKGLYLIIDTDQIHLSLEQMINIINQSTVRLVQLRTKSLDKKSFLQQAILCKTLLDTEKLLIINDHVDIAIDVADGVHLGQEDYPINRVRRFSPDHFLLGTTCHTVDEATRAQQAGASYISVGCLFPTKTKKDTTPTPLTELEKIRQAIQLPICAIGGVNEKNLPTVLSYHVDMVAMISSIWQASDPLSVINAIQKKF